MIKADILTLVAESPAAHGIFDATTETGRDVYCEVRSVGMNEFYRALENSLQPSFVFVLADEAEYKGEKICIYHDKRYRVIRTYVDRQRIELTVEEATVDRTHREVEESGNTSQST